ncbi:adenine phosphoribosyltransferase [Loa loa]|uniref:Adenine phosphoribosyltransferase n=1 Tax=Loa loa TaxID=7209 RepID=A0A1I7VZQ8_LOALO|nr:adenine phosphoribosyltransferase [Loa loa]EFO16645.1 adenine phosphoribosyltransferase [Loa loa]
MNNQAETLLSSKRELKCLEKEVGSKLRVFSDFPRPGIKFIDVMLLMRHPLLLEELCAAIAEHARAEIPVKIDAVAGLEARGFLFGPQIAMILKVPFVPIRKKGKLPGKTHKEIYQKEYGEDVIEIQEDAISQGSKILLVDDVLATGGSLKAAISLVEKAGGDVAEAFTLIELAYLEPRKHLPEHVSIYSFITLTE